MVEVKEVNARALDAVARELAAVFAEARGALEAAAEAPEDARHLEKFAGSMRTARGVLRVIEVYGAALLAEEMDQTASFLAGSADPQQRLEGLDALMRSAVQLPTYLERVLGGGRDLALVLLPLLNDLRAVRGAALLSEGTLLSLNLSSEQSPPLRVVQPADAELSAGQWARRLRPRFQVGLLGLIRAMRDDAALAALGEVAAKLETVATTRPLYQLWWVVGAVIESLRDGGLEESVTVKRLLGQADRELRRLYEEGEERYVEQPPLDLLNNLLFYIARSRTAGLRVAAVRTSFRLDDLLPVDEAIEQERESLSAPSQRLMHTVAAAIREDLDRVKDALDLFTRKGGLPEELAPQVELLKKIGDTLAVLGLGSLREQVQGELGRLGDLVSRRIAAEPDTLIGIATVLIGVEDSLDDALLRLIMPPGVPAVGVTQDPEFRQVAEAVLRECSVNLARIKELVAQALEPGADIVSIDAVAPLARGITAGLLMLGKARATDLMARVGTAVLVALQRRADGMPPGVIDRLADAIVSIEYYMETLHAGRGDPWYMLDNAERCLGAVEAGLAIEAARAAAEEVVEQPAPAGAATALPPPRVEVPTQPLPIDATVRIRALAESLPPAPEPISEPISEPVVEALPDASAEALDVEMLPVFIEEAREEIEAVQRLFPLWDENPADQESLARVRRAFHTLKGSGRMVGAMGLGRFAWSIEDLLNRLIDGTRERSPELRTTLREAVAALPGLVDDLERHAPLSARAESIAASAAALAEGTAPRREPAAAPVREEPGHEPTLLVEQLDEATIARMLEQVPPAEEAAELQGEPAAVVELALQPEAEPQTLIEPEAEAQLETELEPELEFDATPRAAAAAEQVMADEAAEAAADQSLQDIYRREVMAHLEVLRAFLRRAWTSPGPHAVSEELYRACHTLRGASRTAEIEPAVRVADPLHRWMRRLFDHDRSFGDDGLAALADAVEAFEDVLERIDQPSASLDRLTGVVARIAALDLLLEQSLAVEQESVASAALAPAEVETPEPAPAPEPVVEPPITIEHLIPDIATESEPRVATAAAGYGHLLPPVDETSVAGPVPYLPAPESESVPEIEPDWAPAPEPVPEPAAELEPLAEPILPLPSVIGEVARALGGYEATPAAADYDPDIAAIFCEEATELLEAADAALGSLRAERGSRGRIVELQRVLHTVKGGARMAGVAAMGDLSHELESLLIQLNGAADGLNEPALEVLQASLDELSRMRDFVNAGRVVSYPRDLITRIRLVSRGGTPAPVMEEAEVPRAVIDSPTGPEAAPEVAPDHLPAPEPEPEPEAATEAAQEREFETSSEAPPELPAEVPAEAEPVEWPPEVAVFSAAEAPALEPLIEPAAVQAVQPALPLPGREFAPERVEMARVDPDLLDAMLNNAGEASIYRSRLEQQLSSVEFNLAELGRVVQRLKDQLRKLEIETEAQILHRHVEDAPRRDDFDPLELDRYSTIQQYSRALGETASDVASVQSLLGSQTREAQTLLTQQGRVISDLQNELMRTRMVPFQRHAQRLTRIVRQAASEYGKRADLAVTGTAGEIDRQVLDRMLPPFEHLLRNAVVHGIEPPAERIARGKPEAGRIELSLRREGSEVVIVVSDDGAGINLRLVRDKAVALGYITPKQDMTDEQALQLILEPGFSTAQQVTQSAGRGVGMDVVATEIKRLGGSLYIESEENRGSRFNIRLPFTLAISNALILRVGAEFYALPMPTVEGVVRVPVAEVRRLLSEESAGFDHGGQRYRFLHLAGLVGGLADPPTEHDAAVPVILVRAGEHSTGVVSDELVGSREIVVKSVGPQIAGIRGISGATILGDGRICIILDVGALVRSEWRSRPPAESLVQEREDRRAFALVVDDSITVRRVTQRLLERNGMRVMTAKDGLDAIGVLQDHLPDVILLDIEMPRMDGYEVASHVRNDERLKEIPIVMITSRVGEKHRARAIELGVDEYLGKPYQESQLLEALEPLLRRRKAS